jgi:hypothetical protein
MRRRTRLAPTKIAPPIDSARARTSGGSNQREGRERRALERPRSGLDADRVASARTGGVDRLRAGCSLSFAFSFPASLDRLKGVDVRER